MIRRWPRAALWLALFAVVGQLLGPMLHGVNVQAGAAGRMDAAFCGTGRATAVLQKQLVAVLPAAVVSRLGTMPVTGLPPCQDCLGFTPVAALPDAVAIRSHARAARVRAIVSAVAFPTAVSDRLPPSTGPPQHA